MFAKLRYILIITLLLLTVLALPQPGTEARGTEPAPARPAYAIDWWTADGGSGGVYPRCSGHTCIGASAGQPEAGSLSFKDINVEGGFWPGIPPEYFSFVAVVLRN